LEWREYSVVGVHIFGLQASITGVSVKGLKGCKTLNKDPDPKNPLEGKEDRSVWILVNSYEEFSLMHEKQIRLLFLALPHWIFADLATVFRFPSLHQYHCMCLGAESNICI